MVLSGWCLRLGCCGIGRSVGGVDVSRLMWLL